MRKTLGLPIPDHHSRADHPLLSPREVEVAQGGGDLFKFALELREMMYEHYFSQERQQKSPADLSTGEYRSPLQLKMPLLRANKLVRADALPSFYKCHVLGIRHHYHRFPDHRKLSSFMTSGSQPMRKVELQSGDYIDNTLLRTFTVPYLQGFLDFFPKLQLLILHFYYSTWPAGQLNLMTLSLLAELLERLDYLKIVLYYHKDDSSKGLDALQVLAPRARWIEESPRDEGGMDSRYRKIVWALHRCTIPETPGDYASGIKDESEEV